MRLAARLGAAALAGLSALPVAVAAQAAQQDDRPTTQQVRQASPASQSTQAAWQVPPARRQAELRELVLQDCGSCHGMRLTGGLGPALTARALRDRPAESLVATIVHGRPGTAMPPWEGLLTQAEAAWIVERLIEGDFGGER